MLVLHAADLHIDSPLRGAARYEGRTDLLRGATRRAFEALVDAAIARRVALVLIAGDVFDGSWRDYATGLFYARELGRLRDAGIPVVSIRGNHDAASVVHRSLRLPPNLRELSWEAPETHVLEDLGVAVHGQSFASRSVTDDLARRYPPPIAGLFNVGLLHTGLDGAFGHDLYAPTSVESLVHKGYDYWALGHVHDRLVLAEDPWVVFPGNLQGRHAREAGPKGATLLRVEAGRVLSLEALALDVVRWAVVDVQLPEDGGFDDAVDLAEAALRVAAVEAGRHLAARVRLRGATRAHGELVRRADEVLAELRRAAADVGGGGATLERVAIETTPPFDVETLRGSSTPAGRILRAIAELRAAPGAVSGLVPEVAEAFARLPSELRGGDDALDLDSDACVRALLDEAERRLVPALVDPQPPSAEAAPRSRGRR